MKLDGAGGVESGDSSLVIGTGLGLDRVVSIRSRVFDRLDLDGTRGNGVVFNGASRSLVLRSGRGSREGRLLGDGGAGRGRGIGALGVGILESRPGEIRDLGGADGGRDSLRVISNEHPINNHQHLPQRS